MNECCCEVLVKNVSSLINKTQNETVFCYQWYRTISNLINNKMRCQCYKFVNFNTVETMIT